MVQNDAAAAVKKDMFMQGAITYGYITLWIALSAMVILINKYILGYTSFVFPISLTMTHMAFCAGLAALLIKLGVVSSIQMDNATYYQNVVPIAALFSGTLWLGNAAYLYLSISFIQMIKAQMPVAVFAVGTMLGTERYSNIFMSCLLVVSVGVAIASYGEIEFNMIGFLCQAGSILTESSRLCLIQILLQSRGIKLNPVTTLYYIAPACFACLCLPWAFIELPVLLNTSDWEVPWFWLIASMISAFALNMSVFLLIGRSSALTMNVAGVVKDWLLIMLSVMLYHSIVTKLQLAGYGLSFAGVTWYNYLKMKQATPVSTQPVRVDEEKQGLLETGRESSKP
ncbi:hypothetical protein HYH03_011528 [Edaphochlamys debaryana]|uniref:Sugar phosphate transporter domain-containing protein n=1 Tax=Edaphochlamys debaryana TaxID=47281 RepID=A0A836BWE6_9CHLO|nr:hypothetical protein HYH03_011528 [Edaphochlamys debaryana]|eukprot:KAG2490063.1 hypothetical protein HYH03_011528 [Edaphochlamys debaryana]